MKSTAKRLHIKAQGPRSAPWEGVGALFSKPRRGFTVSEPLLQRSGSDRPVQPLRGCGITLDGPDPGCASRTLGFVMQPLWGWLLYDLSEFERGTSRSWSVG
jgi:hypothetical protein